MAKQPQPNSPGKTYRQPDIGNIENDLLRLQKHTDVFAGTFADPKGVYESTGFSLALMNDVRVIMRHYLLFLNALDPETVKRFEKKTHISVAEEIREVAKLFGITEAEAKAFKR